MFDTKSWTRWRKRELTVVSPVIVELLVVQVDDVCAHVIQEALVMRDNEQCLLPALEVAVRTKDTQRTGTLVKRGTEC